MSETRKQILLKKAAELIGSRDELAAQLNVPGSLLEAWISGDATMPDGKLMHLAATLNDLARSKPVPK